MGISAVCRKLLLKSVYEFGISSKIITLGVQDVDGYKYQDDLFDELGFQTIHSLDVHSDENPTYLIDLCQPIPNELICQYDLVYDGGTLEHVFDIKSALYNIVSMVKKGGRVIHMSPMNGWINHGFYMF